MSDELSLWGPVAAATTPATVFTNVPGTVGVLESLTLANPLSGGATTVILSLLTDDAATRVVEYPVPAGAGTWVVYPMLRLVDASILQLSSTLTNGVVITTGNGYREGSPFSPLLVPEIAAGYFWDAEVGVVALGATNFRWTERGGKTAADMVQTTGSKQPSYVFNNSHAQLRYDKSTSLGGAGTKAASTGNVTVGWTGATYVCGWWRVNGTIAASINPFFSHTNETNPNKRLLCAILNATTTRITISTDGSAVQTVDFANPAADTFLFLEFVLNPSAASGARGEFWINRVKQTITAGGITSTTIADVAAKLGVACRSAATENAEVTDCGWCAYANGIPSDFNRDQLYNYKRAA